MGSIMFTLEDNTDLSSVVEFEEEYHNTQRKHTHWIEFLPGTRCRGVASYVEKHIFKIMCALTILSLTLSIIAITKNSKNVHVLEDKLNQQSVDPEQISVKPQKIIVKPEQISVKPDQHIGKVTEVSVKEVSIYKCNAGWFQSSSACYFVSRSKLDWFGSAVSCREHDARLLEIKSSLVEKDLENSSLNPNKAYWLGARDDVIEGIWIWSSGANMNFTKWNPGEPNGGDKENCLILENNGWNDHKCNEERYFICQQDMHRIQLQ
ncbi:perlucin-like protein [Mytilus trossulus]|uniref:perlucin-like protein n=1 Tax=Mytilus trossulus TaxID=6551 RepID=UPI003007C17C